MAILISTFVALGVAIPLLAQQLKKRAVLSLWLCAALALLTLALLLGGFRQALFVRIFGNGVFPSVLFLYVMLAPVVPAGRLKRSLYMLRAELSIYASFFIWVHNIYFGREYFVKLFTKNAELPLNFALAAVCSLLMLVLLFPLCISSFPAVRRRMPPKRWKKLQRTAYIFYGLSYLHLVCLWLPSAAQNAENFGRLLLYTLIYGVYVCRRLQLYFQKSKQRWGAVLCRLVPAASVFVLALVVVQPFSAKGFVRRALAERVEAQAEAEEAGAAKAGAGSDAGVAKGTAARWADGVWEGSAFGYKGEIFVQLVVKDERIESVEIIDTEDDADYFKDAAGQIPDAIVREQSAKVDSVSGATLSSKGIMKAAARALKQAEKAAKNAAQGGQTGSDERNAETKDDNAVVKKSAADADKGADTKSSAVASDNSAAEKGSAVASHNSAAVKQSAAADRYGDEDE